jgi:hypothetical protein
LGFCRSKKRESALCHASRLPSINTTNHYNIFKLFGVAMVQPQSLLLLPAVYVQIAEAETLAVDRGFLPSLVPCDRSLFCFNPSQVCFYGHTQKSDDLEIDFNATSISWDFRQSVKTPPNWGQKNVEAGLRRELNKILSKPNSRG